MATLRDTFGVNNTLSGRTLDQIRANDMGSLRRGWESGQLGSEANNLGAEWASANAEGDTARANTLRGQIDGLQARQSIYRPEVSQLEGITGVGDLPGYVMGLVGQNAASMAEPAAVATGLTALGTGLRLVPNPIAKGVGTLLQTVGAPGAAYAINQKQLKGEFANDAVRDPELMARTSPEQLNRMATGYGLAAGALDTVLPGMVGRTLGGATLRAGAREAAGSVGGRFVRNMFMEGGTETLQDMGSKFAQGTLNPNRDTSGDAMSYANSFVGGAVGSGPFAGAEALGDAGANRISGVAGAVKEKAGAVVDMAQPYTDKAVDAVKAGADKVRGKVVSLATGDDGAQSVTALKDNLKAASQEMKSKWQATQEERDLILGTPPKEILDNDDPLIQDKWIAENNPHRVQAVVDRLDTMGGAGDQRAVELLQGMSTSDPVAQSAAVDAAADYIISQTELGQLEKQASRFGEVATTGGKAFGKAAVWAARKAGSAAKTFGSAVWDGVQEGSKKNAQGFDGADRMAEYLNTTAKAQGGKTASGPIARLLKDMGYEIAELADLADSASLDAKPDLRRNLSGSVYSLGVNRIVNSLRTAYGAQTEQVIGNLRQMAAPSAAPIFDAMHQELAAQRADKSGAHTAQIRATSAAELTSLLDAQAETKLLKEGINLRAPESQRQLLGMVEAVSLGRAAPQARKALEGLVGRDTLNKMLAAVAPQTEQDAESEALVDDGGETAAEGFVVDDETGEISQAETSVYDREAAEKSFAKGEGSRVYGFFGTGNRTDLNSRDPFAATTKLTRDEYKAFQQDNINRKAIGEDPLPDPRRRPRLFAKGQQLSEKTGGGLAIAKKIADLEKYLKVDRTPERMAALMREEGNEAGAAKVEALIARGDEKAKATLDNAMKSFFVNRAGGWRVSPKSAWDVLKEQKAQPTRILALYRDYLRQDGETERAELVNQVMLDMMDGVSFMNNPFDGEPASVYDGAGSVLTSALDRPGQGPKVVDGELQRKGGGKPNSFARTGAAARRNVPRDAKAYFREREIAVAERLSNRDPMKLDETELLQMHEAAQKIVDLARKGGGNKMIAAANILTFKSGLSPNGKLLHIKVSDLVYEVQKRQNESVGNDFEGTSEQFSNARKNQKYLDMVLEGVGMVMDSGRVDGWPYKLNEKNQKEYFGEGENGVPPSLMLATTTNAGFLFGKEQKAAGKMGELVPTTRDPARYRMDDANPIEVEKTLGQDGPFVPDARVEQDPSGYETRRALSDAEYAKWNALKTSEARGEYLADLREKHGPEWSAALDELGVHGTQFAVFANLGGRDTARKKNTDPDTGVDTAVEGRSPYSANRTDRRAPDQRGRDDQTQLDVQRKPKGGRSEAGAPDEYADQRARSVSQGYDAAAMKDPVERKGDAVARAAERAVPIVQALKADFPEGLAAVERRLRTAEAPEVTAGKDKNKAVGGSHYAAPLAYALSAENVAMLDLSPAEAKQIQALRVRVAKVLLEGKFKPNERVTLTRALATEEAAAHITAQSVNKYLTKVVGKTEAPAKEGGASLGKPQSAPSGVQVRESSASGYAARTRHNADAAGATLAIAADFSTAGEKLTARLAGNKLLQLDIRGDTTAAGRALAAHMQRLGTSTLNVAGNGIYTLTRYGLDQATVNKAVHDVISAAHAIWPISFIVSGGQTGVDIAGAVAAKALGIPAEITLPAGYVQRDADGVDRRHTRADIGRQIVDGADSLGKSKSTPSGAVDWSNNGRMRNAQGAPSTQDVAEQVEGFLLFALDWAPEAMRGRVEQAQKDVLGMSRDPSTGELTTWDVDMDAAYKYVDLYPPWLQQMLADHAPRQSAASQATAARVQTPAFRRWFGGSKVVDASGKPMVMYHGTQTDFNEFRPSRRAGGLTFVVADPKIADGYAIDGGGYTTMGNAEDRVLVEQFLREVPDPTADDFKYYDLPADVNSVESLYAWIDAQGEGANVMPLYVKAENIFGSRDAPIPWRDAEKMSAAGLKAAGYDAVWVTEQGGIALAVVDPKQLKSAIGNSGEYDPTTADVRRNAQDGRAAGPTPSTQAERDAAVAEIRRTLGDKVKVEFADITGYSGEFVDVDNLIRISTTPAAGTLQTAYHESLHAFFKQFVRGNPLAMDVVKALAEHKPTLDRVHALLDGYPEAQAALANGEERLAYMYQFWRAGLLDLPYGKPRTLFQKVLKAFRRVLGQVSDLERSTALLQALAKGQLAGEPSVAGKVINKALNQGTWTRKQVRKMDKLMQTIAAGVLPANDVLASSDSLTAKKLATTFWTNPGDGTDGDAQEGYLNARARMAARYVNEFSRFVSDLNDRELKDLTNALQREDDNLDAIPYAPTREAAKHTRALIQRFRKYMVEEKGLKLGDRGPNYFPRVWDTEALMKGQDKFMALMTSKYADMLHGNTEAEKHQSAMALFNALITNNMVDGKMAAQRDDGVLTPFYAQGQGRILAWMDGADVAEFQSKDVIKTLTTYFHSGARAAEYAARFGQDGKKLDQALHNIELELMQAAKKREVRGEFSDTTARDKWVERQMRDVRRSVDAMEGSIGKNGGMALRKFGSAMTVYQNVRLLPLAIFSQVVDPLGMLARGATMKQAFESFMRGMTEVGRSWGDMFREEPKARQADKWEKLAMAVGSVDAAMFSHHVAEEYSSTYMSPLAKKINDTFFRVNGMEGWNRGMRVGATKAAVEFLQHHKQHQGEHSVRWLRELGLKPADVLLDSEGELLTDWRSIKAATGWDETKARAHTDKVHYAINRWVQGAVLTPNAAQRPAWSSDPRYSMFFHLKQFSYSFHKTIMTRAVSEMNHGNLAPLMSFAWYIPAIIAADVTKGMAINGGELPQHLKGMDLSDWIAHGVDRSGVLGVAGIGIDATGDLSSLAGPGVEQIIDGFSDELGATTLNALPASPIAKALLD